MGKVEVRHERDEPLEDLPSTEDDVPYFDQVGRIGLDAWLKKLREKGLTVLGEEINSGEVIAPPVGFIDNETIFDQMYRALARMRAAEEAEEMLRSQDEEDEFPDEGFPDDDEPFSPYEERQMRLAGLQKRLADEYEDDQGSLAGEAGAPPKGGADAPAKPGPAEPLAASATTPSGK